MGDLGRAFRVGTVVRHFKYDLSEGCPERYHYMVLSHATHTETKEAMVVYKALYGDRKVYARPADMFYSKVDKAKYPEARQDWRFEQVDGSDE